MEDTNATPNAAPQPYAQGVSNPPDNGNVEDTGTNANTDNTADIQAAQQGQPESDPAAQGQPNQPVQAGQSAMPPNQPGQPNQPQQPAQPAQAQTHPAVQRAGLLNEIATALAGGPRYKTTIDPNTGESSRAPVPMSKGQIGLAIALEALSGGLSGLGEKGTNATGKAAAVGLQQGQQIAQQRQEQQKQQDSQANADFAHHAQMLETNMRLANNAMQVGRMDDEANDAYVAQFAPLADNVMKNYSSIVQGVVSEQDLQKHHIAKDSAIPYQKIPRLDPETGEQVKNAFGVKQWDHNYIVIDPKFKADDLLTDADKATAAKYHLSGFVNGKGEPTNLPQSLSMKLGTVLNLKAQIGSIQLAEHDLADYHKTLDSASTGSNDPVWKMFGDTNKMADFITNHEGSDKEGSRGQRNNNPGNIKATSPTQQQDKDGFRTFASPEEGRQALVAQLQRDQQKMPNATPEQYFEHYSPNSDKGNGDGQSEAYAAAARKAAGAPGPGAQSDNPAAQGPDLADAIQKDPTLTKTLTSFQAILNQTAATSKTGDPSYGRAIAQLATNDPSGAGKIAALYGGRDQMVAHDSAITTQREVAQDQIKENFAVDTANKKGAAKAAQDQVSSDLMQKLVQAPPNYQFTPDMKDMTPDQLKQKLQSEGVQVPSNFESLYLVAHNRAPLTSYAARVWNKGAPSEMDQQTATTYMAKFINPDYNSGNYNAIANERKALYSGESKQGQTLLNAGTAANHLEMLRQANEALHNNNLQMLNHVANELGVQVGKTPALTFEAIGDKAADEVSKVAMGSGSPYKEQIDSTRRQLSASNAPEQNEAVIRAFTGLMSGRLNELDDFAKSHIDEHIKVAPSVTSLFQRYGMDTPWNPNKGGPQQSQAQQPKAPGQFPGEAPKYVNGQLVGFINPAFPGKMRPVQQQAQ